MFTTPRLVRGSSDPRATSSILSDAEEARRAEAELVTTGFAQRDIKIYAGKQILGNYEVYVSRRTVTDKVVGSIVDDSEGRDLYLEYAREDRSALWLRMPTRTTHARPCESSPIATTYTPATTAPRSRQTFTSLIQGFARKSLEDLNPRFPCVSVHVSTMESDSSATTLNPYLFFWKSPPRIRERPGRAPPA